MASSSSKLTSLGASSGGPVRSGGRLPRETERTAEERAAELAALPSLKEHPLPEFGAPPGVDPDAPPPPAPTPWPEPEGFVDRGLPIPESYGMDRVVAAVRDPCWLYVYWELSGGALERVRFQFSQHVVDEARWVLRVFGAPRTPPRLVDIDRGSKGWYLKVAPNGSYCVELGFFGPDNRFEALCRSAEVRTPALGISPIADEHWMIVKRDLETLLHAGGWSGIPAPSGGGSEQVMPIQRFEHPRAASLFSGHWPGPAPADRTAAGD
ncbi:MAG: DUF4912 domain-containing protein [Planctomycetota bacterium]|nr:DUF4912 domain-containing protein [Planctomycetota bacterium]